MRGGIGLDGSPAVDGGVGLSGCNRAGRPIYKVR